MQLIICRFLTVVRKLSFWWTKPKIFAHRLYSLMPLCPAFICLHSHTKTNMLFEFIAGSSYYRILCLTKLQLLQAQDFRTTGTQMRRKMWLQNMKIKLIVLAIIIALILIIVLSVCHGFKC